MTGRSPKSRKKVKARRFLKTRLDSRIESDNCLVDGIDYKTRCVKRLWDYRTRSYCERHPGYVWHFFPSLITIQSLHEKWSPRCILTTNTIFNESKNGIFSHPKGKEWSLECQAALCKTPRCTLYCLRTHCSPKTTLTVAKDAVLMIQSVLLSLPFSGTRSVGFDRIETHSYVFLIWERHIIPYTKPIGYASS